MLYRVGQIVVYGTEKDPRLSMRVWKVSNTARIGRIQEFSGLVPLEPPLSRAPREWLLEALEQLPER